MAKAAEDSLQKLLPFVGRRLTMDSAMLLLQVHESGNQRVAPAIESAWAACALTKEAVANEPNKRRLQKQREEEEWAKAREERARKEADPEWQKWNQARREHDQAALRALQADSPYKPAGPPVKTPDEPKHVAPEARNSYDPNKGGTPQKPNP